MTPGTRVLNAGIVLALLLILTFGVAAPPEECPTVSTAELRRSAQATVDWFVRNQAPDGRWLYEYDKDRDVASQEYNNVRHAGAVMGLYQAGAAGIPGALISADRGAQWALDHMRRHDDWSAFAFNGVSETGATALLLAGLEVRKEAAGDRFYDDLMRRLARYLVAQTEPSGAVLAYYDWGTGKPRPGAYSQYYTGEAYWALARMHLLFPGEGWDKTANRIGAYLATKRDKAEHHRPPIADHWAGYGLADTVEFPERGRPPLTGDEVHYAREQAELFGAQARWVQVRAGPWGALARGPMVSRGGGYGVIDEGFTGLWRAAGKDARLADVQGAMAVRATCVAGLAVEAQATSADAAGAKQPQRVAGAWFRDGVTRMDDQQHALAGLLRTIPMVPAAAAAGFREDPAPALLWILALLLALNPPRVAFGLAARPRREVAAGAARGGRSERPGRELAAGAAIGGLAAPSRRDLAAGAAIGGALVCVVALLAEPLLEALGVSGPGFRTAAGVVAILTGVADFFRRPPSPEPALPGRRAALVPVAFPLVARPALLILALGAGADHSVLVTLAAMVLGVAAIAALPRLPRWTVRVLAAGLVVCGVLLGIDGVLSV